MDIEQVRVLVSSLKAGGKVYKKGESINAPFHPSIVSELRVILSTNPVLPTLEITKRKSDPPPAPVITQEELVDAETEAKAKLQLEEDAKQEAEQKVKDEAAEVEAEAKAKAEIDEKTASDGAIAEAQARIDVDAKKVVVKNKKGVKPPVRKPVKDKK